MARFIIEGGHSLAGELTPQGAKNEALQIICATLLTDQEITITNIPEISDVINLIDILRNMGVVVTRQGKGEYTFCAANIDVDFLTTPLFSQQASALRGSIMIIGPMLARFGNGTIPQPGGDKIGRRRLDTHFRGFESLGAQFIFDAANSLFRVEATKLKGSYILLDEASVTGTANLIMAAVLADGTTTIYNAACEPYVQQLCHMLVKMGARIDGIGSNLVHIHGVTSLTGCRHRLLPDMIEVGSFIGLAVMTASDLLLKDVSYDQLGIIPESFKKMGINLTRIGDDIRIPVQEHYEIESFIDGSIMTISDAPWPGLTPDLLSIFLVIATQARGSVLIHQKMFESRLFFVDRLIDMGSKIILCDPHRATVIGLDRSHPLRGTRMTSPDIRAGVALLIAALSASGLSVIDNIDQIDRGYENIDVRLNAIGAKIRREG